MSLSRMNCELSVFKKHHLCDFFIFIYCQDGLKDRVHLKFIAGLLTNRTHPFRIGCLGSGYDVIVQVEAVIMGAEETSSRNAYPIGGKSTNEGNFDDFTAEVFRSSQVAHPESCIQYFLRIFEACNRIGADFIDEWHWFHILHHEEPN